MSSVQKNGEDRFHELLVALLRRSRQGEVAWQEGAYSSGYQVDLGGPTLAVGCQSPDREPDVYWARMNNSADETIFTINVDTENSSDWALLSLLYEEARRAVIGWDKALEEAERALSQPGVVGVTVPPKPDQNLNTDITDDDIPF